MLRHQLGQDLVLGLDLFLQVRISLLLGGVVGPRYLLKGSRPVLEELSAGGRRPWAGVPVCRIASKPEPAQECAVGGWRPSPMMSSASVPS